MTLPRLHWLVFPLALACLVVAQDTRRPPAPADGGSRPNLIGLESLRFAARPGDALEVYGNHSSSTLRLTLTLHCGEEMTLALGTREVKLGKGATLRTLDIPPGETLALRPARDNVTWSVHSLVED